VGKKSPISHARLLYVVNGDGDYGTWQMWTLVDLRGNLIRKFGAIPERFKISKSDGTKLLEHNRGDVFAFNAMIKEHCEYKEIKFTLLGRLSKLNFKIVT
jgi:hypothetical protein